MASHGWVATADVTVYSSFSVTADKSSVNEGDSVQFTAKYDGVPGPAPKWKWIATDTSNHVDIKCADGDATCKRSVPTAGKMWAFTSTTPGQGDSNYVEINVTPVTVSLSSDYQNVGLGDTVTFTASIAPTGAQYSVVGWSWKSDEEILANLVPRQIPRLTGLAATVRRIPTARSAPILGTRRMSWDPNTDSTYDASTDSTLLNASDTTELAADPDAVTPTSACNGTSLTCAVPITNSGTMSFTILANGKTRTASTHVAIDYYCPLSFPIDYVLDVGELQIALASEKVKLLGLPRGTATITLRGPWTRARMLFNGDFNKGEPAEAQYRPSSGEDDHGNIVLVNPTIIHQYGSVATFACYVTLDKDANFRGRMKYLGHYDIDLVPPHP